MVWNQLLTHMFLKYIIWYLTLSPGLINVIDKGTEGRGFFFFFLVRDRHSRRKTQVIMYLLIYPYGNISSKGAATWKPYLYCLFIIVNGFAGVPVVASLKTYSTLKRSHVWQNWCNLHAYSCSGLRFTWEYSAEMRALRFETSRFWRVSEDQIDP